jgi:hypothetical protein
MGMLMVEFSFPLVRTFRIMLFMHVSFMMPWIIMMIIAIAMTMVWVYCMMIIMWIVLTFEVFWSKSVMDEIVWVLILMMLPFIVMAIMMKIVIILKMLISVMVFMMISALVTIMLSMVLTVETVLEMEVFILLIKVGKMMTIMSVTVSKSMPFIMSPMSMTVVVRMCWIMDWLSFFWYPVNISVTMMVIIMIIWLHFQYEVSAMYKGL